MSEEQRYIDIPIVALPPPGAVTVLVVDEHGHYAARFVARELLEPTGIFGQEGVVAAAELERLTGGADGTR